ncbi:hypothetical protein SAMN05216571_10776 [Onishia taeanensis]|uniref:Uncharacterized protein n=1 Tax=Onishia taeanensis TaxID=284577 RepID=A0A1G7SQL6_9GAMM|nr:hypothetical protein SAMN05216571_10776 [Halomonas taeanensis]
MTDQRLMSMGKACSLALGEAIAAKNTQLL